MSSETRTADEGDGGRSYLPPRSLLSLYVTVVVWYISHELASTTKVRLKAEHFGSQPAAAKGAAPFNSAGIALGIVAAPLWGAFSDSFGRIPLLLVSTVPYVLSRGALVLWGPDGIPAYLVMDNLLVIGACEVATMAYVADVVKGSSMSVRAAGFGWLVGVQAASEFVGGVLGAELYPQIGARAVCGLSTAGFIVFVPLVVALLRETLPKTQRAPCRCDFWASSSLASTLQLVSARRETLGLLFCIYALVGAVLTGSGDVLDQYAVWRFHFSDLALACFNDVVLPLTACAGSLLAPKLVGVIGAPLTIVVGLTTICGAALLFAFTPPWQSAAFVLAGLLGIGQVWKPALIASVVADVDAQEQGCVQGSLSGFQALVGCAFPMIFAKVFYLTQDSFPGGMWLLAAAIQCLAVLLAVLHAARCMWRPLEDKV